jgi:iron complex transport system permease protein
MKPHSPPQPEQNRIALHTGVLLVITLALMLLALCVGADGVRLPREAWAEDGLLRHIVLDIRAPRMLGAWCVGALLGLAGGIAQGLFRNPLAEPYLLGSASGASLFVALFMLLSAWVMQQERMLELSWALRLGMTGAAFTGAGASVLLTIVLAGGARRNLQLLLAGVVVGVVMGAATALIMLMNPNIMPNMQSFMWGNTAFIGWAAVGLLLVIFIPSMLLATLGARGLNALALGELTATSLGLPLARFRLLYILLIALATGAAVAQAGLIAFIGLAAPHIARGQISGNYRLLLPAAAAYGGLLLLLADVIARILILPEELPVGIITALVGGVYLLVLMHRRNLQGEGA